jgi:alkaline phosphatase D
LLDNRQYRSLQACTRNAEPGSSVVNPSQCEVWADPRRSLLGAEQEKWLATEAARSRGPWNVLAQSTAFGTRDYKPGAGQSLWNDGWDGYAPSRDRVRNALAANPAAMPVILGGDVHANWVGHVLDDYTKPNSAKVGVEFCGTSVTARSTPSTRLPELMAKNPHYTYIEDRTRGYGVVEFTPKSLTTTLRGLDDVSKRKTQLSTLATFAVEAGQPVLQQG